MGDHTAAAEEYRRATKLEPKNASAHFNLGLALYDLGDCTGAAEEYRRAIELEPDHAYAHYNLGLALYDLGDCTGAAKEYRRAIELEPDHAYAHFSLGRVLDTLGDYVRAVASFRRGIELKPNDAKGQSGLGFALQSLGQFTEALSALRRSHKLGSKDPNWRNDSEKWVRYCERMILLEPRVPKVLSGEDSPKDADEAIAFATLCYLKGHYVSSGRLFEKVLSEHRALADDLEEGHRFGAACAAALAGCANGEDIPPPDDASRTRWRAVARTWLRSDLQAWKKRLEEGTPEARDKVKQALNFWKARRDLAGLRDELALTRLPGAEHVECQQLWADVETLIKKAARVATE